MKKCFAVLLTVVLCLLIASCSNNKEVQKETSGAPTQETPDTPTEITTDVQTESSTEPQTDAPTKEKRKKTGKNCT